MIIFYCLIINQMHAVDNSSQVSHIKGSGGVKFKFFTVNAVGGVVNTLLLILIIDQHYHRPLISAIGGIPYPCKQRSGQRYGEVRLIFCVVLTS